MDKYVNINKQILELVTMYLIVKILEAKVLWNAMRCTLSDSMLP